MKKILFTLATASVSYSTYAQTNTFPLTGNVGMGTLSPTHTLTLPNTATGIVVYNTADQTINYERARQYWSGSTFTIATEYNGAGIARPIQLYAGSSAKSFILNANTSLSGIANFNLGTSTGDISSLGVTGTLAASSGVQNSMSILHAINQSGTAGYRGLWISPFMLATGSRSKYLIDAGTNSAVNGAGTHSSKFNVDAIGNGYFAGNVAVGSIGVRNAISVFGNRTDSNEVYADLAFWNNGVRMAIINSSRINNDTSASLNFYTTNSGERVQAMFIAPSGNVTMGASTGSGYKLAVNGKIHTREVRVDLNNWPDYVFQPTYILPSLTELRAYINKNQHLPEMPSEAEVTKNGIGLGEIVKLQTKKIEELTLYMIEKEEQIKKQEIRIAALEKTLLSLTAK